jgi:hypothetical protein
VEFNLKDKIGCSMMEFSDIVIQGMSDQDILNWLQDSDLETINFYMKRYERLEFYEVCAIIRDYLNILA